MYMNSFFWGVGLRRDFVASFLLIYLFQKMSSKKSLFRVPDGSSPSAEKQIGGEPPRGFGVFVKQGFFLGKVTALPHADVEFRCLSYKTPASSTRQSKHKLRPFFAVGLWIYNIHHSFRDFTRVSLQDSKHLRTFIVVCKIADCHGCSCDEDSCGTAVWKGSCFWGGQWCRNLTPYRPHPTGKGNTNPSSLRWFFSCYLYGKMAMFWAANMKIMLEQADTLNTKTCFGKAFSQKLQGFSSFGNGGSHKIRKKPFPNSFFSFHVDWRIFQKKVSPEATIGEFKGQLLHQWQADRSKLCVRIVLHDHVLVNDNETVVHAGEEIMCIFVCKNTWCGTRGGKWMGGEKMWTKTWECNKNGWSNTRDDRIVRTFWTFQWIQIYRTIKQPGCLKDDFLFLHDDLFRSGLSSPPWGVFPPQTIRVSSFHLWNPEMTLRRNPSRLPNRIQQSPQFLSSEIQCLVKFSEHIKIPLSLFEIYNIYNYTII